MIGQARNVCPDDIDELEVALLNALAAIDGGDGGDPDRPLAPGS